MTLRCFYLNVLLRLQQKTVNGLNMHNLHCDSNCIIALPINIIEKCMHRLCCSLNHNLRIEDKIKAFCSANSASGDYPIIIKCFLLLIIFHTDINSALTRRPS